MGYISHNINLIKKGYNYSHKKIITSAFPTISNIELTNACGMKCIMCPRQYMKRKIGFIDVKLFEDIIKQMKFNHLVVLHHFGDPLLHPKIEEILRICQKYGIKSSLSTNPTSLTPENINRILNGGLDHLHISLDGATKETYEKIRRGGADYALAIKNINNFLAEKNKRELKKPYTVIAIIQMKETKDEIDKFKEQWTGKEGIDEVEVKEFITWDGSMNNITRLGYDYSHKFKRKYYYPCFWPWGKITVTWDGKVVPCCFDYDAKVILGDLTKQSLNEIWNGDKMKEFRKMQIDNSFPDKHLCKNCREREGFVPSKIYPLNLIIEKKGNILKYFKYN